MRKPFYLAILASLLLPSAAGAFDVTRTPIIQRYLAIAGHYWGQAPCASYTVEVGPMGSPGEAEAAQPGCWQRLSPEAWSDIQEGFRWRNNETLRTMCVIVLHEYGHSTGHGHSADPRSVMYPKPGNINAVPGCTTAFPLPGESRRKTHHHATTHTHSLRSFAVTLPDVARNRTLTL